MLKFLVASLTLKQENNHYMAGQSYNDPQTGFKLPWYYILLGLVILGYTFERLGQKQPGRLSKALLFDNPEATMRTMERTGIGTFQAYPCKNVQCQAFTGFHNNTSKCKTTINISLKGTPTQIDSAVISITVSSGSLDLKAINRYIDIVHAALSQFGVTGRGVTAGLIHRQESLSNYSRDYAMYSTYEPSSYQVVIKRRLDLSGF